VPWGFQPTRKQRGGTVKLKRKGWKNCRNKEEGGGMRDLKENQIDRSGREVETTSKWGKSIQRK